MPTTLTALVRACHPEPTAGVTLLSTALAAAAGAGPARTALVASTVLTGQLSIGWCNDVVDRGRDAAAGREDKPVAAGDLRPRTVALAAGSALVVSLALSAAAGPRAGAAHAGVLAGGWAYDLGLKRTTWSWLPYAVAFGLLPAYCVLVAGAGGVPAWLVLAGALLGTGAHFLNVVPDIDDDRATGVRSLPVLLGAGASRVVGSGLLFAAACVLVLGPAGPPRPLAWAGLALATAVAVAAALSGARAAPGRRSRAPFLLALVAATVDVALLVVLVRTGTDLR